MVVRTGAATVRQIRAPRVSCPQVSDAGAFQLSGDNTHLDSGLEFRTYCSCHVLSTTVLSCIHQKPSHRDFGVQGMQKLPALSRRTTCCPKQSMQKGPEGLETSQSKRPTVGVFIVRIWLRGGWGKRGGYIIL